MQREQVPLVLGLRADAETISLAALTGTQAVPLLHSRRILEAAAGSLLPDMLASLRQQLLDAISDLRVVALAIRLPESIAQGGNKDGVRNRMRIDGMMLEVAGTHRLPVVHGPLKTLGSVLGEQTLKQQMQGLEFRGLQLAKIRMPMREAIVAGISALPKDGV